MDVISFEAKQVQSPTLSDYADFRVYLKDFYQFKRSSERSYSYTVFSARADIKSPNYLKLVIEAKRNLSEDMALRFAKAIGLDKEQTQEFLIMVRYGQATKNEERNLFLRELAELRVKKKIQNGEIKQEVWENIPSWITWVIYEMADLKGVNLESDNLHQFLRSNVKPAEVKVALQKLLLNGELEKDVETGEIRKTRDVTKQRDDIPVQLVKKLQSELIQLGMDSLYHDDPTEREFGALTVSLTQEEFEKLKFELRHLRKRVHKDVAVSRKETKGDRVYQLNLQLFPITK
jgi:uncharacterized protein (TIGR02147 family)